MAISFVELKTYSRSSGQSAIAKAAYNSATHIKTETVEADFTRKRGIILAELIQRPGSKIVERVDFWKSVEAAEKRKDSQICRELQLALPRELTREQREALAREAAMEIMRRYDLSGVDLAIHEPPTDHRRNSAKKHEENPHAHILIPTRDKDGKKLTQFNKDQASDNINSLRDMWTDLANAALAEAGCEERIYCRDLDALLADIQKTQGAIATLEKQIAEKETYLETLEMLNEPDEPREPGSGKPEETGLHTPKTDELRHSTGRQGQKSREDKRKSDSPGRDTDTLQKRRELDLERARERVRRAIEQGKTAGQRSSRPDPGRAGQPKRESHSTGEEDQLALELEGLRDRLAELIELHREQRDLIHIAKEKQSHDAEHRADASDRERSPRGPE